MPRQVLALKVQRVQRHPAAHVPGRQGLQSLQAEGDALGDLRVRLGTPVAQIAGDFTQKGRHRLRMSDRLSEILRATSGLFMV
ncbi:hypothetical protein SDC9_199930 [bioreactor metagenome]|uniref:Uncharacterized protein n=1 Tax=bioreactor metagenome TaxID=1076179 RepID=A0A645IV46_9ZZZZ